MGIYGFGQPQAKLGPFEIDPLLKSVILVDNKENSVLRSFELRKFAKTSEYQLSHPVTRLKFYDNGFFLTVV